MDQEQNQVARAQAVHTGAIVCVNIVGLVLVERRRRASRTSRTWHWDVVVDGEISDGCLAVDGINAFGWIDF